MITALRGRTIPTWGSKVFLTLADQGFSSGGNLLLNLLLTRWLTGEAFGLFVLSFSVFLLLSGLHNSVLLEPISVLGVDTGPEDVPAYMAQVMIIHVLLTAATTLAGLAIAVALPLGTLSQSVYAMLLALPFLLLPWMVRRVAYLLQAPRVAAVVSIIYAVTLVMLLIAQYAWFSVSETSVYITLSVSSLIASVAGYVTLPVNPHYEWSSRLLRETIETLVRHWTLGKWVALQTIFTIGTTYAPLVFAAVSMSAAASGTLRILALLVQPLQQVFTSVGGYLLLPVLAREYSTGNSVGAQRRVSTTTLAFLILATGYTGALFLFRGPLERFLFDPGALDGSWLIPFYGVIYMITALGVAWGLALRGARKTLYYPLSTGIPGLVGLVSAPIMTFQWGVTGGVVSIMCASLTLTVLNAALYFRWLRQPV